MANTVLALVSAGCACGGAWGIGTELLRVYHVRTWPTVTGQVLNSHWRADAGDDDRGLGTYDVQIEYQYSVSGCQYSVSKRMIGLAWNMEEAEGKGANLCQSYSVGNRLPIAYSPTRPQESEIAGDTQRQVNHGLVLAGLIGLLFSLLAYWISAGW